MGRLSSTFDSPEKNDSLSEASNGPGLPETYKISKSEIEHASDAIGHGVSSTVYKGTYKNAVVALKKFTLDNPALPHNERLILRECTELLSFRHENIISCYGVCVSTGTLVLEFCEKILKIGGNKYTVHSLRQLIDCVAGAQKKIPYDLKLEALYQISSGLSYLHQRKLIHGDLKSANVLVTGTKQDEYLFKLCDLGQAHVDITSKIRTNMSFSSTLARKRTGTVSFEAPEVLFYLPKSVQSDIYSFAMVMFELLNPSLSHPWASDIFTGNIETVGLLIAEAVKSGKRPSFTEKPNKYTGLMIHCWAQCPSDRPTSTELNKNICSLREGDVQKEDERIAHQSELAVGLNSPLKRALLSTSNRPTPSTSIRRQLFNVPTFPVDDLSNANELQTPGTPSNKTAPSYSRSANSIKGQKRNWLDNREQVSLLNEHEEVDDKRSHCLTPVRSASIRPPPTKLFADRFGNIENDGKPNSPTVGTPEAAEDDLSHALPTNTEGEDNNDSPPEDLKMKWSGYASTKLGFALRQFQSLALFALHRGKDLIIIQATGS